MRKAAIALAIVSLFGCDPGSAMTGSGGAGGGSGGSGGGSGGAGGGSGGSGGSTGQRLAGTIGQNLTIDGDATLADNATVATGVTLTFTAGSVLHAASGKTLSVQGTLAVEGSAATAVAFQGEAHAAPGEWAGLVVSAGGTANLSYLGIHNASTALTAAGNSHYTIDHLTVDTSTNFARLSADGAISKSAFHGLDNGTPGGPFTITNASPHLTDVLVDHGHQGIADMVIVDGASSSPVFDHVEVAQSHCAFHFNQGTNIIISNSFIHDNSYALMVEASTNTHITGSNLETNQINVGSCAGGSVTVTGCYLQGMPFEIGATCGTASSLSNSPLSGVGPRP
jgi:hypothetical protein